MRELDANEVARPYRSLSVQEVDVPLEESALREFLIGRPVYRRTEFMVLINRGSHALLQLEHDADSLFSQVRDMRLVAGPAETVFLREPDVDVGIPSRLAQVASACGHPGPAFVVEGRYGHVNFILDPQPVTVTIVDVVPPDPPKLLAMAEQVIDFDEALPPIVLELHAIDMAALGRDAQGSALLFPCRSSGLSSKRPVSFLDSGPAFDPQWVLVGCERSRQVHRFFYDAEPHAFVSMCPRTVKPAASSITLRKCCLRERGIECQTECAEVAWGANLDEVRDALRALVGQPAVARELPVAAR
jgi:hypothetical protein